MRRSDAANFIANNAAHAGKAAQARIVLPTGTARAVVAEAENALQNVRKAIPGTSLAPKVTTGLPGVVGGVLKAAGPVGAVLSAQSLKESVNAKDQPAVARDVAGVAAGTLETVALASSYVGGGAAAAGTGGAAAGGGAVATIGGGAAAAAPVVGAAAVGLAIGVGLEKGLNVSNYSAAHGTAAYNALKNAGVNETAAFVAGGVVTVASTPVALAEAAIHKALSWFD
jgi:hypothetical protein